MPTFKATLLLVLAAVTGAAAAPASGGTFSACYPGEYSCGAEVDAGGVMNTCNGQGQWVVGAYCSPGCCRQERTEVGRFVARCVC